MIVWGSGKSCCNNPYTTLVLESRSPDFSTDAGNSALIFKTKSPRSHADPFSACQPDGVKKHNHILAQQGGNTMSRRKLSRRQFVAATAMSSAALISAPFVRGAYAAGKLSIGFWDHWVPGANKATTDLTNEWAAKEKVEVSIDYITSVGNKNLVTIAAEAAAKSGHDIMAMPTWWSHAQSDLLEPVNDIMDPLIKQNGAVNGTVQYLGKAGDKWLGVPACIGSQIKGPCSRIDLLKKHAGI